MTLNGNEEISQLGNITGQCVPLGTLIASQLFSMNNMRFWPKRKAPKYYTSVAIVGVARQL